MGWSDWFSDGGDKVSEKVEKNNDGSKTEHYIRSTDGDKSNHTHVVVNRDSDGRASSAHGNGAKNNRR